MRTVFSTNHESSHLTSDNERECFMTDELLVIKDITERLDKALIHYMITGSIALSFYTTPRFTRDIDVVIEVSFSEWQKIVELFEKDYYISFEAVKAATETRSIFHIIHIQTVIKVDFIVKKIDEYRQVEFNRKIKKKINCFDVWMVSKEDLILSKLVWAKESESAMQLTDVKSLLVSGQYESDYLESWAKKLSVSDLLLKVNQSSSTAESLTPLFRKGSTK